MNDDNNSNLLPIESKFRFLQNRGGGCSAYEVDEFGIRSSCADFSGKTPLDIKGQMENSGYSNFRIVEEDGKKFVRADRNYLKELDIIKSEIDRKEKT